MKITVFYGDVASLGADLVCEPYFGAGYETEVLITTAHLDTLQLADTMGLDTVAFRCVPVDTFGSQHQKAAVALAIDIVRAFASENLREVFFYSPRHRDITIYLKLLGAENALN